MRNRSGAVVAFARERRQRVRTKSPREGGKIKEEGDVGKHYLVCPSD